MPFSPFNPFFSLLFVWDAYYFPLLLTLFCWTNKELGFQPPLFYSSHLFTYILISGFNFLFAPWVIFTQLPTFFSLELVFSVQVSEIYEIGSQSLY